MSVALIALGANLGDRAATLHAALAVLGASADIQVARISSFHETAPVGGPPGQGQFLNAAAKLQTDLDPEALLKRMQEVEQQFGRVRTVKDGPRTLDLDLLLYDDRIRGDADPLVPHPRMHERSFVLGPLAEIAGDVKHPILGVTISTLRDRLIEPLSFRLDGMRAMVTGSSRGIGRAIALAFATAGANLIVHGRNSAAPDVAEQILAMGRSAVGLQADLRNAAACDRLLDEAWDRWGGIDVFVNNAGMDTLTGEAAGWSFNKKLAALLDVDVTATIQLSRAVGERMMARGGNIINIGWDQAETGMDGDSGQLFAATKAAVMAFSKSLAATLAPRVRVNCIAPGWIKTSWGEFASDAWQERVLRETPMKRWGTPADVAAAAVWLASPAASFVTGQVIRVNGGAVR